MSKRGVLFIFFIGLLLTGCKEKTAVPRGFDQEKIAYYNASEAYNYNKTIMQKPNPVLGFFAKVVGHIARFFNTVLGYILLAGLIFLLVWVLFRYVNQDRTTTSDPPTTMRMVNEQTVGQIDFTRLIEQALAKGDYRLAVRFRFLDVLKKLSASKLIRIKDGKTNYEYYRELPAALRPVYKQVLAVFEYVWYGEFAATAATYDQLNNYARELASLTNRLKDA